MHGGVKRPTTLTYVLESCSPPRPQESINIDLVCTVVSLPEGGNEGQVISRTIFQMASNVKKTVRIREENIFLSYATFISIIHYSVRF